MRWKTPHALRALPLAAAGLALTACGGGGGGEAVSSGQPNVVLISIDTLRPDFLGSYGNERDVSPAMDALAAEGTIFTDVTSGAPWTLPGHATMLTGLYPSTHGVKNHDRKLEHETLAERFAQAGYASFAVVNSHNLAGELVRKAERTVGDGRYGLLKGFDSHEYVFEMEEVSDGRLFIANRGAQITRSALQWLRERDQTKPFFVFLHYYDVHTDFTPKAKWKAEFVTPYDGRLNGTTGQLVGYRRRNQPLTDADVRWLKEMYEAEIRTLDEVLVRLFDYLDAKGLADDTIVALTSDHGEEYFEHGGVLHGRTHYQELMAIPLILRGPGVPEGHAIDTPVHLVDLAPTLLSLAGLSPSGAVDGIDLSDHWRDPAALPEARFLYGEADHNNSIPGDADGDGVVEEGEMVEVVDIKRMVRIGHDKLCYDTHSEEVELYDLEADPGELEDLAAADSERLEFLWSELQRFMANEGTGSPIEPPDEETLDLLRALGYVDDGR